MPSKSQHDAESLQTQDQDHAMSEDARDNQKDTDKPAARSKASAAKVPPHNGQNQATIEEFGEEGMGVAPKE